MPAVLLPATLRTTLSNAAKAGYDRMPWGGVEIGGLLYGHSTADTITISHHAEIPIEHYHGPNYELTPTDEAAFSQAITPDTVAWYFTTSSDPRLPTFASSLRDRLLPNRPTLIIRRGRNLTPTFHWIGATEAPEPAVEPTPEPAPDPTPEPQPEPRQHHFIPLPTHKFALQKLQLAVQSRKGFSTLTGPTGTGKTTLLHALCDLFPQLPTARISHSRLSPTDFFALLALDLQLPSRLKPDVLIELAERASPTLIVIDDAHRLPLETLEEIELLGNLETRRGPLLQIVLAADPDFESTLDQHRLRALKQRITTRSRLAPLSLEETALYLQNLPSNAPPTAIHQQSDGIPRRINQLLGL